MKIPPTYEKTPEIIRQRERIENLKNILEKLNLHPVHQLQLRRESLLKSALYSAKIEGNPLTLEEVPDNKQSSKRKAVKEVQNLETAITFLNNYFRQNQKGSIDLDLVLKLHELVMTDVSTYKIGALRNDAEGLFNSAGFAIRLFPPPSEIKPLLQNLLEYLTSDEDTVIKALLGHLIFEKIHPFFDGNGRVGRLLISATLQRYNYGAITVASFEELFYEKREAYYMALDSSATLFLEFMLKSLADSLEAYVDKSLALTGQPVTKESALLPRRLEILNIIRDHELVSLDFIARRFMAVNPRTLRFDLKALVDAGLVAKHGTTKGVFYGPVKHIN